MGGKNVDFNVEIKQDLGFQLENKRALITHPPFVSYSLLSLLLCSSVIFAGPEDGNIVGGTGSISQTDLTTIIQQNTDRLAIDWQSFNVAVDETVQFIKPGSDSIA